MQDTILPMCGGLCIGTGPCGGPPPVPCWYGATILKNSQHECTVQYKRQDEDTTNIQHR